MPKDTIIDHLLSLEEIPDVTVEVTGSQEGTIRIIHRRHHAPEFLFKWQKDHFTGYFIDGNQAESQAILAIYTPLAAIQFVSAYVMLNEIRAGQRG